MQDLFKILKTQKYITVLCLTGLLLITCYSAFHFLTRYFGTKAGYFSGFVFYWSFWCAAVPFFLLGSKSIKALFKIQKPVLGTHKIRNVLFLLLPLVFAYSYEIPKVFVQSDFLIIISSFGLSVVNGTAEEILWRGTFLKLAGVNSSWYVPLSSFCFAIWHFVPLSIFGNHHPGGSFSFVLVSFILGLLYSAISKDTKSIALSTLSHILFDFSGLGGRIYF